MKFYGVGVGPGDPGLLTLRAVDILRSVGKIFHITGSASRKSVSLSVLSSLGDAIEEKCQGLMFSMEREISKRRDSWQKNAEIIAGELEKRHDCAFSTIGDPMIYSTFVSILPLVKTLLPDLEIEVVPGITSFQAAAARAVFPLVMNNEILTIIPAWNSDILQSSAVQEADTAVMLKTYRSRKEVAEFISENHEGEFLYASRVGLSDEQQLNSLKAFKEAPEEYLSMVISRKRRLTHGLD